MGDLREGLEKIQQKLAEVARIESSLAGKKLTVQIEGREPMAFILTDSFDENMTYGNAILRSAIFEAGGC